MRAARFTETPAEIVVDYVLSVLNVAFGLFLVWKRPQDWVARLFAVGMVGVAMGFNYQTHSVIAIGAGVPQRGGLAASFWMQTAHFLFHAISGAAYVTALALFPNGRFVPRWTRWLAVVAWALVFEETFFGVAALAMGPTAPAVRGFGEGVFPSLFHYAFGVGPLQDASGYQAMISAEVTFFTIFFGLVVPIVGIASQVYRYRRASTPAERAQTRVVVWALGVAFSLGLVVIALDLVSFIARGQVFSPESSRTLYSILLRLTPPLYAILPVAIGLAMVRYRLFDFELAVDRTMIYGPLTAAIALVFLGSILIVQQILKALIGQPSELAVALAALVNVFLFQPIRRRVQRFVDARVGAPRTRRSRVVEASATS